MKEFVKGCSDFGCDLSKDEMETVFQMMDKDGGGSIDFDEFLRALRVSSYSLLTSIFKPPMPKSRVELINQAFRKLDKTGDGFITVSFVYFD